MSLKIDKSQRFYQIIKIKAISGSFDLKWNLLLKTNEVIKIKEMAAAEMIPASYLWLIY